MYILSSKPAQTRTSNMQLSLTSHQASHHYLVLILHPPHRATSKSITNDVNNKICWSIRRHLRPTFGDPFGSTSCDVYETPYVGLCPLFVYLNYTHELGLESIPEHTNNYIEQLHLPINISSMSRRKYRWPALRINPCWTPLPINKEWKREGVCQLIEWLSNF